MMTGATLVFQFDLFKSSGSTHLPQPQPLCFGSLLWVVSGCTKWVYFKGKSTGRDNPREHECDSCAHSTHNIRLDLLQNCLLEQIQEFCSPVLSCWAVLPVASHGALLTSLTHLVKSANYSLSFVIFLFMGMSPFSPSKICFWS